MTINVNVFDKVGLKEDVRTEFKTSIFIDPESNTLRSYYPDFLAQKKDGTYIIIEIKGENMIDDAVVQAKARSAAELAAANAMTYEMIPSLKVAYGLHQLESRWECSDTSLRNKN